MPAEELLSLKKLSDRAMWRTHSCVLPRVKDLPGLYRNDRK
jgi:hypothetical protein